MREGEGLNERIKTEKEKKKKKKKGDESDRWEREELKYQLNQTVKKNKILIFCFTIELQCDSTFRIAL